MDIHDLTQRIAEFARRRNWEGLHDPKNLSMALATEAAELLEIFQWMTGEESQACAADDVARARIADEIADVFIYLIRLADRCGIDPLVAASNKLDRNEVRFPANRFY